MAIKKGPFGPDGIGHPPPDDRISYNIEDTAMNVNRETKNQAVLPLGWRWVKLGEVLESLESGGRPKGGAVGVAEGIPSISAEQMTELGTFDFSVMRYVPEEYYGLMIRGHIKLADILIVKDGATTGKVCLVGFDFPFKSAAVNEHVFLCRPNQAMVVPSFLFYWLWGPSGRKAIRGCYQGAAIGGINQSFARIVEVPLPPLGEQERIAAILDKHMAAIEKARAAAGAQREAAEALRHAYYREAFGTITPLSTQPGTSSDSRGWRWWLLKDIARLESGHTPSRYHPEWWGGEIPWLALPDIRRLDGRHAYETSEYTNDDGIANSSARILPAGTVCLSRTASVGFVTMMGRPMATSQDFVNWVCGPKLDPAFLMHLFFYSRGYFVSLASGAIHKTVYMPTVEQLRVLIPEVAKQRQIATRLNEQMASAERLRADLETQLAEINALPAALLKRAFNGEL